MARGTAVAASIATLATLAGCGGGQEGAAAPPARDTTVRYLPEGTTVTNERWTCSDDLRVAVVGQGREKALLTGGGNGFKPSWSRTGSQLFTEDDPGDISEYPRWSADESLILYDSNRSGRYQLYAYRLADRMTVRLSEGPSNQQFGNFEGVPK
jgi:Tol biopolymer transport system component